jgi:Flp pilus assembly protein TadD
MFVKAKDLLRQSILLGITLLCSAVFTAGQIAGGLTETTNTGLGGNNYIVGTVYSPDGTPIKRRMRIQLSTPTWGEVIATTDDSGKFVFSQVGSGVYTVVVDGEKEFQPVRHDVEFIRPRGRETQMVTIHLREAANAKSKEKGSVISASNAGVPKRAMEFYQKASKLAEAKDYPGAIEQLKLAVAAYPAFVNALNQIGVIHLKLNELEKADDALKAALKIKPDAYEPLINRGIALFRLARFSEAETVLRDALKVNAKSAVAFYYLGRTLSKMGRNDEAETAYLNSVKMSPGEFKEAHRLLAAIYLERNALPRVVEELETYLRLVPAAPDAADLRKVIEQSKRSLPQLEPARKPEFES